MRIESSNLILHSRSHTSSSVSIEESLNIRIDQAPSYPGAVFDVQDFSQQRRASNSMLPSSADSVESAEEDGISTKEELKIRMLEEFLTRLSGKRVKLRIPKIKLISGGYNNSGQALGNMKLISFSGERQSGAGFGLIYSRSEIQTERSRVSFSAQGAVKTADGREINLALTFNIDQEIIKKSSFKLRAGEALEDPLVIHFEGNTASFSDKTMAFDLDFDGDKDTIQLLNPNSGYLVLDRNHNGAVDDGRELFGPQTGYGYGELEKYDEDGNGWIDENDSVFHSLKIWYHDEKGSGHLAALTDKRIGAIYLGSAETQMNQYNRNGMAGVLKRSGVVLLENGESRIMQELDLKI